MDQERLEHYRQVLHEEMMTLLGEAGKTVSEMTAENVNFPDPTDRATQESDRNFELRIRDRERKLINKIKEALERIDQGEFGICELCGEEIRWIASNSGVVLRHRRTPAFGGVGADASHRLGLGHAA